jgi:hypothetical protein
MNTPTLCTNYIHYSPARSVLLFVFLMIGCFALLPIAEAVSPPPDGDYPRGNTAKWQNALFSLTSGTYNTAIGWRSQQLSDDFQTIRLVD